MPLNKAKGNMYGFITHTWNPIKGVCPHDCSYCYMKGIRKRFGSPGAMHLVEKELKTNLGKGNFIFVGNTTDMFAETASTKDFEAVLSRCGLFPKNRFLFQSKNPYWFWMYGCLFPDNSVLCTTIETNREYYPVMGKSPPPKDRAYFFSYIEQQEKHITIEPIMDFDLSEFVMMIKKCDPAQVNIGADSGRNGLPEPPAEKVLELIAELEKFTKVVRKPNLERLIKNSNKELHAANAPLMEGTE
jgi:hypothetical protein